MIRIVTDSSSDMSREELAQYGVTAVPLQIVFGSDTYADGVDLPAELFWQRITSGENPKTSQPTPDAFLSVFEEAKAAGDEVIAILLSSGLSGTVQSATLARSMMEDASGVYIVDSLTAVACIKLLILHACKLRDEGKLSAEEIAGELLALRSRVVVNASLDTLDYLARGGRIPKAAASLGALVQLKILITFNEEGKLEVAGKGMGRHRAMDALIKRVAADTIDPHYPVIPVYTYDRDNCAALVKKLNAAGVACTMDNASAIGPTIATHVGPGAYGLVYVKAE